MNHGNDVPAYGGSLRRVLKKGDPLGNFERLSFGDVVPLSFPFDPPECMARWYPTPEAPIGFDKVRCPVSDLFRAHNSADLCVGSWCNLDYPLGEAVGLKLTRDKTLVEGGDRCAFRWTPGAHFSVGAEGGLAGVDHPCR